MKTGLVILAVLGTPLAAQDISVPSGQALSLQEFLLEDSPPVARFRFVAPQIDDLGFAGVEADFQVLCDQLALPALRENGIEVDQIVISLAAAETVFGETNPDVTQFFEQFRPENDACIWEYF